MRIFISYRTNAEPDRTVCDELCQGLTAPGHQVFVDRQLPVGVRWAEEIERHIAEADFLVLLLSEESSHSEMVLAEVEKARDVAASRGGTPRILPVRLTYRGKLPYPLSTYVDPLQHLYWGGAEDTETVLKGLLGAIGGQEEPPPSKSWRVTPPGDRMGPPPAQAQVREPLPTPGGTLVPEDPLYISRDSDAEALRVIQRGPGQTITIKGPRQVGKSSLLMRVLAAALDQGRQGVLVDFQLLAAATGHEGEFFRSFLQEILTQLDLPPLTAAEWDASATPAQCCTRLMERLVLQKLPCPLTLACDEADLVLALPFRNDFFGMFRAWHGKRANPVQRRRWGNLDLVLVTSTEPYLFIDRDDQSPFNVGAVLALADFTRAQVAMLNEAHGTPLGDDEVTELQRLTGGHPYLVRKALYAVSARGQGRPPREILRHAAEDGGPFGDHLQRHLLNVLKVPELRPVLTAVLAGQSIANEVAVHRLIGAGLVRREGTRIVPRCAAYAEYFRGKV